MKITVGPYELDVSEPYAEGQRLGEAEARTLNVLRSRRLSNLLLKRLAKYQSPLDGPAMDLFLSEVRKVDADFQFTFLDESTAKARQPSFAMELRALAEEKARRELRASGADPTERQVELLADTFLSDPALIREAKHRLELIQEVAKRDLLELLAFRDEDAGK